MFRIIDFRRSGCCAFAESNNKKEITPIEGTFDVRCATLGLKLIY